MTTTLLKRTFAILLLPVALLFLFNGCQKPKSDIIYNKGYILPIKKARKDLFLHMATNYLPGVSVAISVDGKTIWSEGLGLASNELEVPVKRETKFRIGEVSQLFTTLVYQLMLEDGTITGEELVSDYIPEFADKKYPLKLKHLVNQCSGLRQPTKQEKYKTVNYKTIRDGLSVFNKDTLLFEPGLYEYTSPFNFNLMGAVIEKIKSQDFKDIIKEMILDTLGMENTQPDHNASMIKKRSEFYDRDFIARTINAYPINNYHNLPSSGYLSTSEDLMKLGNAILNSEYFSDSLKTKMFKRFTLQKGDQTSSSNGWVTYTSMKDSSAFYSFKGNVVGGSANLIIHPKHNLVLAMATNMDDELEQLPTLKIWSFFEKFFYGELEEEGKEKE